MPASARACPERMAPASFVGRSSTRAASVLAMQSIPKLPLERDLRMGAQRLPELLQLEPGAAEGEALPPEFPAKDERLWKELIAVRERRLDPSEQRIRILRPNLMAADLDQCSAAELKGNKCRSVGSNAEITAACAALAFAQIVGQARLDIPHLAAQIRLEFEDRGAEQHIGAAADLGQSDFVIESRVSGPETMPQQLGKKGADILVPGSRTERRGEFREVGVAPERYHRR